MLFARNICEAESKIDNDQTPLEGKRNQLLSKPSYIRAFQFHAISKNILLPEETH